MHRSFPLSNDKTEKLNLNIILCIYRSSNSVPCVSYRFKYLSKGYLCYPMKMKLFTTLMKKEETTAAEVA